MRGNTLELDLNYINTLIRLQCLRILVKKCMASSHVNVKKGTPHVLLMASPHNTSESVCAS